uniref:Pentatricopeptide repeat-containing protein At2g17033 family n=2 Tax=Cajanus cajan TaxID=3821 RepID=A0A151TQF9_CAJCA|nr:Pentatricopeptide repeat-containing protein At2g17033 family [Cajanus cajan]
MRMRIRIRMTLTKQGERFLRKIGTSSATTQNLIQRFVLSSPKSVVLTTLSHLLSPSTSYSYPHLSTLAFPLYARITQAPWFTWTPTTAAQLAALLHQLGHHAQAQSLISEATSKLESRPRELVLFYGKLMDSHSKRASQTGFDVAYGYLNHLLRTSSSLHVKQTAYQYIVSGFCAMDRPRQAYDFALGPGLGLVPSAFELKSVVYAYGRLGLFEDMVRVVDEMAKRGFVVDTVCYNMVLSSYGTHGEHLQMLGWLRRMRAEAVPFSIRTYNSVTNCCPSIVRMTENLELDELALGVEELKEGLEGGEGMVIGELLGCRVIMEEVMVWDSSEVKLDLHGFHLGGAYLIVLLWLEEMRRRMGDGNYGVPAQLTLVCGMGKHSSVRGESRVRVLVQKMMVKMGSPLKVHRNNNGCFIAKGKAVKNWLCQFRNTLN